MLLGEFTHHGGGPFGGKVPVVLDAAYVDGHVIGVPLDDHVQVAVVVEDRGDVGQGVIRRGVHAGGAGGEQQAVGDADVDFTAAHFDVDVIPGAAVQAALEVHHQFHHHAVLAADRAVQVADVAGLATDALQAFANARGAFLADYRKVLHPVEQVAVGALNAFQLGLQALILILGEA